VPAKTGGRLLLQDRNPPRLSKAGGGTATRETMNNNVRVPPPDIEQSPQPQDGQKKRMRVYEVWQGNEVSGWQADGLPVLVGQAAAHVQHACT
jgi:hypothetical protein